MERLICENTGIETNNYKVFRTSDFGVLRRHN